MRAVVLRQFGGPEVLSYEDVPTPEPGPSEVLIRVRSVSVNRTLDLKVRQGEYDSSLKPPMVLGVDPAGTVEALGEGVDPQMLGTRVVVVAQVRCGRCKYCLSGNEADCANTYSIGLQRWGGYADFVVVPITNAYAIPGDIPFAEATVIARHFPAAFNLLENKAELQPGEWVVIMGAAGALGTCGVQVAGMLGARVIAAAGSDERVAAAMSHGAEAGVNYRSHDLADEVMRITDGVGAQVVFENISDPTLWPRALASLASHGRMVTAGAHGGGLVTLDVKRLYTRRLRIIGAAGSNRADIVRSLSAAAGGQIHAVIDRTLPLSEAAAAHRLLEESSSIGKIILDPTRG